MAGNDHPDFSKPVMVGCILGLADAENHLDSILGKLEPFCTLSALSRELAAPARRSLLDVFAVGQFGQAQDAGLGGGIEGGQQRVNVGERPISDVDPAD